MSDTSPRDQAALLFNAKVRAARTPRPSEEVWRLRHASRVQRRELRDDAQAGAGWTVMLFEGDELLFSRRCADAAARAIRRGEHEAGSATNRLGGRCG